MNKQYNQNATKMKAVQLYFYWILPCLLIVYSCTPSQKKKKSESELSDDRKPNVVLIAIDDLNDWMGVLRGHPDTKTPNIDKLASQGMLFTNAHSQGTMCNPSRISILFGKRPSTTGFYSNNYRVKNDSAFINKNASLPRYFREHGYKTVTAGKIYHSSWVPEGDFDVLGPRPSHWFHLDSVVQEKPSQYHKIWDFGPQSYGEEKFVDYEMATWGTSQFSEEHDKPFFCALGFMRPHVTFFAPQRVYDQFSGVGLPEYLEEDWSDIPSAAKELVLSNLKIPTHDWMKEENRWKLAVQAYLASVNWVDEQIGRVLDALEKSKYEDNTIIVLYSDHGYHLGEKQRWSKFSLWERTTRVPLIVNVPGINAAKSSKPVELLSIFRTLTELCRLPTNRNIEGVSLVTLLQDPDTYWEHVAISTLGQNNHSIRSERWRYIQYADGSEELYDHRANPNEWHNLKMDGMESVYSEAIVELKQHLPTVNLEQRGN